MLIKKPLKIGCKIRHIWIFISILTTVLSRRWYRTASESGGITLEGVLHKIQQLNRVFRSSEANKGTLSELCDQLGNIIVANIYLFYSSGVIFAYSTAQAYQCEFNDRALETPTMPTFYLDIFRNSENSAFNIYDADPVCTYEGVERCIYSNRYYSLIPVFAKLTKGAGILLIRYGEAFTESEEALCEYAGAILSIELIKREQAELAEISMEIARTKLAVGGLTYSELKAGNRMLQMLPEDEGVVFLNAISEQAYVTHSTVSATLKKLESAGFISTKNRGVKGKQIVITGSRLREEMRLALKEAENKYN